MKEIKLICTRVVLPNGKETRPETSVDLYTIGGFEAVDESGNVYYKTEDVFICNKKDLKSRKHYNFGEIFNVYFLANETTEEAAKEHSLFLADEYAREKCEKWQSILEQTQNSLLKHIK